MRPASFLRSLPLRPGHRRWCRRLALVLMVLLTGSCAPPASTTKTTVTWMVPVTWTRPATEELVAAFERAHPDIAVHLMWVPVTQYQTKFKTLAAAGQAPDLIETGDVWVAYMLPFLRDLTTWVERDQAELQLDDFYPQVLQACQHQGRYYFLANSMNLSLLYYNKALFREAGVAFPTDQWTWGDYVAAGQRLTRTAPDGKVLTWGSDLVGGWWGEWLIYVRQAGGQLFNDDFTRCTLDSPAAIAGLQMYYDKVHTYHFAPASGRGPAAGFAGGKLAMLYGGHVGQWRTYNAIPGLDWDVAVLPSGPAGRAGGEIAMGAYGITKDSRQPAAAWELLKFIVSQPSIRAQVTRGTLSVRKSVAAELLLNPDRSAKPANMAAVYQQLAAAQPIPRSPDYIEVALDIVQPEIDLMMLGELSPTAAAQRATTAANRFLAIVGSQHHAPAAPAPAP